MIISDSSTRLPRPLNGAPHHSNSLGSHPIPTPRSSRLPVISATEATCRVNSSGFRGPTLSTCGENRMVEVAPPIAAEAISGSTHSVFSSHMREPSGVYGYSLS